ncbi:hypothetical protein AZE42_07929 [Rhizopogon vesiculosus]|uniref:5'-Nucleotidase C-terminal domain-containing protein n=1 Tax=Rhizopogon vesiculosus TaxID=180088 RepID=A0A1J8QTI2_9AGAM|nr:hypothetical protein AZE42_07929 [Rhizopogon vesiculosus]
MSKISITHFNDVYRVTPQKFSSTSSETIDVSKFAGLLDSVRVQWENRPDGKKEGLTLFSGDAFSPSMEGSVTRGSHMTAILNALDIDVAVAGNHDFDFGYPHFCKLTKDSTFKFSKLSSETIDVSNFGGLLDSVRAQWENRPDGKKDGLTLFSGDAFSPSMESSVTRGSHMMAILNALGVNVALAGNHDFDYGYPHFCKLTKDSAFPWLLSNIIDENTGRVPIPLQELQVVERRGVRIGLIGLVEKQWIATLPSWPVNFQHRDMAQVAIELSKRLRDPNGEYKCDIILALTHCRLPNDIQLAKDAYAFSPSAYDNLHSQHGVDLILGGHDHEYYASKAMTDWEGFDATQENPDSQSDTGDVLLFKSGTDFREFSDVTIELQDTPEGSVRKKIIQAVHGKRQVTKPDSPSSSEVQAVLESQLSSVQAGLKSPVCKSEVELDLRSKTIRTGESAAGNWIADVIRHAYDDSLCMNGRGGSDGVLFCAGTFRGDSVYSPGNLTLGNILEILPFSDPVVVLELTGQAIWAAMESALSAYPAHEGLANDIQLAKDAYAFSPSAYDSLPSQHGIDLILGGHDHEYYVSKAITDWEGFDATQANPASEGDTGDILLFKSGTDFREFSDVTIELQDAPEGCVRKKIIQAVRGKRQVTKPDSPSSNELQVVIGSQLSSVQASSNSPVCKSAVELDLGRKSVRGGESPAGNWFADVLRHAYDDSLCMKGEGGSDGVIFCSGTLRGGSVYPPGNITLGNILEILPWTDPVVVLELTGQAIWDVMESALSRYPAYEGRFPVISGFRVSWDSQRPAGQRVLGIWLQKDVANSESNGITVVDGDEIKPDKEGKKYKIVTREYLAQGNDGYDALTGHNYIIDDETGQIMSSIVRKYLLGSHFINRLVRLRDSTKLLHSSTAAILSRELEHRKHEADDHKSRIAAKWQRAATGALNQARSKAHYQDHINVAAQEPMDSVDCFNRATAGDDDEDDLPVIHPVVDGRLKNVART